MLHAADVWFTAHSYQIVSFFVVVGVIVAVASAVLFMVFDCKKLKVEKVFLLSIAAILAGAVGGFFVFFGSLVISLPILLVVDAFIAVFNVLVG